MAGAGVQYTLRSGRRLRSGAYQAPLAALVCNFPPDPSAPLSANAAGTLFHEFGHVSRLSRAATAAAIALKPPDATTGVACV